MRRRRIVLAHLSDSVINVSPNEFTPPDSFHIEDKGDECIVERGAMTIYLFSAMKSIPYVTVKRLP